jgi:hypothetical protein
MSSLRLTVVPVVPHQDLQYHLVQPVAKVGNLRRERSRDQGSRLHISGRASGRTSRMLGADWAPYRKISRHAATRKAARCFDALERDLPVGLRPQRLIAR